MKQIHCEITGQISSLEDTTVLTRIKGIIILKNFVNPKVDEDENTIFSSNKPPLRFYSEITVPHDLIERTGRIFSIVEDEDELEQSTNILSQKGKQFNNGMHLVKFMPYIDKHEMVHLPDTMFMSIVDNRAKMRKQNCDNWNIEYNSISKKYRSKNILAERKDKQIFGMPGILLPGYDVGIGDCSQKNPQGTGYSFKTDNKFQNINIACNESAVEYCSKNQCLIYYNDFLNEGKPRVLSAYTEEINRNLQNPYLFRSSNI